MLWDEGTEDIVGRKEEIGAFNAMLSQVSAGQNAFLMINGGPGTGKTLLLRHFRNIAEKAGLLALYVKAEKGEGGGELFGRLYQEMLLHSGQDSKEKIDSAAKLAAAIGKAGKKSFGTILLIDDIDRTRKARDVLLALVAIARAKPGKMGLGIVVSSTKMLDGKEIALLRLRPFNEQETRELVGKALGKGPPRMGEECLNTLMADSNGNPRIFKSACWYVYNMLKENEKIISKGHYLARLPAIMSMLEREWFGRLYQDTPAAERQILAVLAKSEEGMHVSDIAKKLGRKLGPTTALTGRLLDSGQIIRLERGRYRIFARLYAKYVAQRI
ncbi:MAG: ATP-binding protein [Candidatus Aenigmatarchaeota archaeon]